MNTDRLNQWLSLGANIGVLIGIILLVIELGQNQDMMRSQIRNELSRGVYDLMSLTAGNKDMADAVARASSGEELTPTDAVMLRTRNEAILRYWENAHYQYRQGMYEEDEFSSHLITMSDIILGEEEASLIGFWCKNRTYFSTPFIEDIDRILSEEKC